MALHVTDDCVFCGACEDECPNLAISVGEDTYIIDPDLCTECVGHFEEPQCSLVCPAECIVADPANVESREELVAKFEAMSGAN